MGGKYGANTSVSTEKSRNELERTLARYGAEEFVYGSKPGRAMVGFKMRDRFVRFLLTLPDPSDREFTHTAVSKQRRSDGQAYAAWEQACRQRWRALNLVVKAKLEAVESGITTFEQEFLAHLVLPGGATVGEWVVPQLEQIAESGEQPTLLPGINVKLLSGAS